MTKQSNGEMFGGNSRQTGRVPAVEDIFETLHAIVQAEKRLGYSNAAVFGGFAAYVERQSREAAFLTKNYAWQQLARLAAEYADLPPARRREAVEEMERIIRQLKPAVQKEEGTLVSGAAFRDQGEINRSGDEIDGEAGAAGREGAEGKRKAGGAKSRSPAAKDPAQIPVQYLKGVGPGRARLLERLGIATVGDLLYYFPRAYEERKVAKNIAEVEAGEKIQTVRGRVGAIKELRSRPRFTVLRVWLTDDSGGIYAVWFNQPHVRRLFKVGDILAVTGKAVENYPYGVEIQVREFEVERKGEPVSCPALVPVYAATEGLPPKVLRRLVEEALRLYGSQVNDLLPPALQRQEKLMPLRKALEEVHFPRSLEEAEAARQRLAFEELFLFQMGTALLNRQRTRTPGIAFPRAFESLEVFYQSLPFLLTSAQERVIEEILTDMERPLPMNRLLQGDVGSGKTVVAAAAVVNCVANGYQAALMVPTEILAEQHCQALRRFLAPLDIAVALLKGGQSRRVRENVCEGLQDGSLPVVVGTQALIQEGVQFSRLGLVVIDEQHRFGVRQRAKLQQKGAMPDILVMTATPIPRTLALTLYGDMDVSVLDEMPPGRKPVITSYFPETARSRLYHLVEEQLKAGRQAYFVCPLVEESENLDVEAAVRLAEELQTKVFPQWRVGLLHGRMAPAEKESVMWAFRTGRIDILVSTTVIEVGIDVPNASVMVIEDAGRFGLAQLHQLRGRVGRGDAQGFCFLVDRQPSSESRKRLAVLERTNDGFAVAEEDLKLRGPGEYLGLRQHGVPEWRVADLTRDLRLLERARKVAQEIIRQDQELKDPAYQAVYAAARERLQKLDFPVIL